MRDRRAQAGTGGELLPHGLDVEVLFAPLADHHRIGLAVSGGPDSLGLMLLAARWAAHHGKQALVYTVDHGLRPEAAAECALVNAEAEKLGLDCTIIKWSDTKPDTGVQAAARAARYRLIGEAMRLDGVDVLLTAHHRNDQSETMLMRMAHGSGLSGLCGMSLFGEVEGVRLCRPLLDTDPAHLRELVRDAGLTAVADPSNTDEHYERVRWRHTLPLLAREGLDAERFMGLSRRLERANAALDVVTGIALKRLVDMDRFGVQRLDLPALALEPEEIGLRVLERVLVFAGGGRDRYRLAQVEDAFSALIGSGDGHAATLGGAALLRQKDNVLVFREFGRMTGREPLVLTAGADVVWDGRFDVSCGPDTSKGLTLAPLGETLTREKTEALVGPTGAPMRALAGAPVLRNADGVALAIGSGVLGGVGIALRYPAVTAQIGQ